MKALWVIVMLVALTQGKMDTRFCLSHTYTRNPDKTKVAPDGLMDYVLAMEKTILGSNKFVEYETTYMSVRNQFLMRDIKGSSMRLTAYAYPKTDTSLTFTRFDSKTQCQAAPLVDTPLALKYNIKPDPSTKVMYLAGFDFLVPNTERTSPVFIRQEDVRGIPCNRWHLCAFQAWSNATVSADFFYNTPDFEMPGSMQVVPIGMNIFIKRQDKTIFKERYDFSFYTDHVDPKDKALERSVFLSCENNVKANNDMPQPPTEFKFEAISRNLGDTQRDPPPSPKLEYLKESYSYITKAFSIVINSPGTKDVPDLRTRIVHDYNSGTEYTITLTTGQCTISEIKTGSLDFKTKGQMVVMRSPEDFFHMKDLSYQYMGRHYHFDRGIDADVYTAVEWKNGFASVHTLWFASQDFLKDIGYKGKTFPLRYRETTTRGPKTYVTDLFKFSTQPRDEELYPDVSMCFAPHNKMYLTITLAGTYEGLYQINPTIFRADFNTAMLKYSGIISFVRIAQFRVRPADKGNTLVQFTLLDKPPKFGNAENQVFENGLDKVWAKLKSSLDSGEFELVIHNSFGTHNAKAISYSKEYLDPSSFKGRTALVTRLSSSTSGYGPGAMGGLGVGMLLLGLILGFGSVKGAKKYRDSVPDINMQQLGGTQP